MSTFWLSRDEVRDVDRRAIGEFGVSGIVLMENAGRGCAEWLMRLNPERRPVLILCGPGNNGGDGFVIARHLDIHGWPVTVAAVQAPGKEQSPTPTAGFDYRGLPPDAHANYEIVRRAGIEFYPLSAHTLRSSASDWLIDRLLERDVWVVDALFGTGLSRALESPYDEIVSLVNAASRSVLAVDIPSGLDCDSGQPLGFTIRASHTATFVALKRGLLAPESRAWTGEVQVMDIGAPRVLVDEYRSRLRPDSLPGSGFPLS